MRRRKKSYFPISSWRLLIAVIVVVSLATVLVVFGRADFPRAQKTDPSKLTECQKRILQGTVRIQQRIGDALAIGSGVVIGEALINGKKMTVILTAAHIAAGTSLVVESYSPDGVKLNETGEVQKIRVDQTYELAVIAIPYNPSLPVVKIAAESPEIGDVVDVYGCLGGAAPCLRGREGYQYFVDNTAEYVNPRTRTRYDGFSVNVRPSSPIAPTEGTSGGPVTNKGGEIAGVCNIQYGGSAGRTNVVSCRGAESIKDFINNLPIVLITISLEEEYLNKLMKELEDAIKNAGAPIAP